MMLQDAADSLGSFIGKVLPALDDSLARIGDHDWEKGTRDIILRVVAAELIQAFSDDEETIRKTSPAYFREQARFHLARYVIAQSLATWHDKHPDLSELPERISTIAMNFGTAAIAPENTPAEDFARATPGVQVVSDHFRAH